MLHFVCKYQQKQPPRLPRYGGENIRLRLGPEALNHENRNFSMDVTFSLFWVFYVGL